MEPKVSNGLINFSNSRKSRISMLKGLTFESSFNPNRVFSYNYLTQIGSLFNSSNCRQLDPNFQPPRPHLLLSSSIWPWITCRFKCFRFKCTFIFLPKCLGHKSNFYALIGTSEAVEYSTITIPRLIIVSSLVKFLSLPLLKFFLNFSSALCSKRRF